MREARAVDEPFRGRIGRLSPQGGSFSEVDCCSIGFAAEAESGLQSCCAGSMIHADTVRA